MVRVKRRLQWSGLLALFLAISVPIPSALGTPQSTASRFGQSASQLLRNEFSQNDISYLLLDAGTGAILASNWKDVQTPIPLGSLVKPFTALAFGERHALRFPRHFCAGSSAGCWLPRGHGEMDLTHAIAYSCNSYFLFLTESMTSADLAPIASEFGFEPPPPDISSPGLAGLGDAWRVSPSRVAYAYLELVRRRDQPGVAPVIEGMRESALVGTGAEVDRSLARTNALVKTGTAVCTHRHRAPGDGFVVALSPSDNPKILLMVRVHGVPGAKAAKVAGAMLHRIEE